MHGPAFFDGIYERAGGDDGAVPWQHALSRPFIGEWLEGYEPDGDVRAMVVAAGLGDDAAALARTGATVTAFDVSPTAVAWAKERHADLEVEWRQADLFDLPAEWAGAFDLVVEVFTVQSIQPSRQAEAAHVVADLVAPGGTLVVVALIHHADEEPGGPPWPIRPETLEILTDGFDERSRRTEPVGETTTCVRIELQRPTTG